MKIYKFYFSGKDERCLHEAFFTDREQAIEAFKYAKRVRQVWGFEEVEVCTHYLEFINNKLL